MPDVERTLNSLKRTALREGVDLCGFSIHQGFVSPDKVERQKSIDHTLRCIEKTYACGSTPGGGTRPSRSTN